MNYKLLNDSALDDLLEEVIADIAQDEHNSTAEPVTVTTANLKAIMLNSTMRSSILANIANFSEDGNCSFFLTASQVSASPLPPVKVDKIFVSELIY